MSEIVNIQSFKASACLDEVKEPAVAARLALHDEIERLRRSNLALIASHEQSKKVFERLKKERNEFRGQATRLLTQIENQKESINLLEKKQSSRTDRTPLDVKKYLDSLSTYGKSMMKQSVYIAKCKMALKDLSIVILRKAVNITSKGTNEIAERSRKVTEERRIKRRISKRQSLNKNVAKKKQQITTLNSKSNKPDPLRKWLVKS